MLCQPPSSVVCCVTNSVCHLLLHELKIGCLLCLQVKFYRLLRHQLKVCRLLLHELKIGCLLRQRVKICCLLHHQLDDSFASSRTQGLSSASSPNLSLSSAASLTYKVCRLTSPISTFVVSMDQEHRKTNIS